MVQTEKSKLSNFYHYKVIKSYHLILAIACFSIFLPSARVMDVASFENLKGWANKSFMSTYKSGVKIDGEKPVRIPGV